MAKSFTGPAQPVGRLWAWADATLAASLLVWGLASLAGAAHSGSLDRHPFVVGAVLIAVQAVPLAVRRQHPLAVLTVVLTGAVVYGVLAYQPSAIDLAELVALYTVGAHRSTRTAAFGALGAIASLTVLSVASPVWSGLVETLTVGLLFVLVTLVGIAQRRQRARASRQAAELQQARIDQAKAEERLAMARELHDAVGHSQTVVLFHAGVARMTFDSDPGRARRALDIVEDRSRSTLEEMQLLVDSLRNGDGRVPLPTLGELDALIGATTGAGIEVSLSREGTVRQLPAAIEVSAYRIVQEALTNVVRHARAHRVQVTLRYGNEDLGIEIRDDGTGAGRTGPPLVVVGDHRAKAGGKGLVGMRERALSLHGRLDAGPGPDGGFAVTASLPLPRTGPAPQSDDRAS